jgi:hypothetical protein
MGTLCLISGRGENSVRGARARRKTLVQTLFRESQDPRRSATNRLAVYAIAAELDRIRKYSARSGADKEARFKVVINRPTFQSPT